MRSTSTTCRRQWDATLVAGHVRLALLAGMLLTLSGCVPASFANTPYQQEAGDAASLVAAAATSIELAHTGELDPRYARASIRIYRDHLATIPAFGGLRGAPDNDPVTGALDAAVDGAIAVLADPCLDDGCDWRGQLASLREAGLALEDASS